MKQQVPLKTSEWYSISTQFNFRVFVFQPVFPARLLKHISKLEILHKHYNKAKIGVKYEP